MSLEKVHQDAYSSAKDAKSLGTFAVRCGRLYTGDGAVRERCWLIVENGKLIGIFAERDLLIKRPLAHASSYCPPVFRDNVALSN